MHLFFRSITSANMCLTGIHSEPRKRVLGGSSIRCMSTRKHTNQHQVLAWTFLIDILKHVHRINNLPLLKKNSHTSHQTYALCLPPVTTIYMLFFYKLSETYMSETYFSVALVQTTLSAAVTVFRSWYTFLFKTELMQLNRIDILMRATSVCRSS